MKVEYRKNFLKDLSRIPSKVRTDIENFAFDELPRMKSIAESGKVERMKGYRSFYKVRFGSYRVGIRLENDTVVFEKALHPKKSIDISHKTHNPSAFHTEFPYRTLVKPAVLSVELTPRVGSHDLRTQSLTVRL